MNAFVKRQCVNFSEIFQILQANLFYAFTVLQILSITKRIRTKNRKFLKPFFIKTRLENLIEI